MFRATRGQSGFDADSLDQARERVRREEPGLYRVDEIRADPFVAPRILGLAHRET